MAVEFNMNEADNYGGSKGSFFSLKNDGDKARVRFLYKDITDVKGNAVHRVKVGDKERWVGCIRAYNEPVHNCPLCAAGSKVQGRLFLKLYNEDDQEVQIWERSKAYFKKLQDLSARYSPLCSGVVEVTRKGAKGDMKTDYLFWPDSQSDIDLEDEQYQASDVVGTLVLDKSFEDLATFVETGSFPEIGEQSNSNATPSNDYSGMPSGRRTPGNTPNRRAF